MNTPWGRFEGLTKLLVICATVLLLASGLCGMQWFIAISSGSSGGGLGTPLIPLGVIELIAIALSMVGIVVILVFWCARSLYFLVSGRYHTAASQDQKLQTLFPRDEDESGR